MLKNSELQTLILLELMAPDPYSDHDPILTEQEKNLVHYRWNENIHSKDWEYILEPIQNVDTRSKFITLLQHLDND